MRGKHKASIEVVFVSADHDEASFESYFKSQTDWLAIPFEEDAREACMGKLQTKGIPNLKVFGPDGVMKDDNAVGTLQQSKDWAALIQRWSQ